MPTLPKTTRKDDYYTGRRANLSKREVHSALEKSRGRVYLASQMLECHPNAIYRYMQRYPETKAFCEEIRERAIEVVEDKLFEAAEDGKAWAVQFFLKCQAKHRGYVERQEHNVTADIAATLTVETVREALSELRNLGASQALRIAKGNGESG